MVILLYVIRISIYIIRQRARITPTCLAIPCIEYGESCAFIYSKYHYLKACKDCWTKLVEVEPFTQYDHSLLQVK